MCRRDLIAIGVLLFAVAAATPASAAETCGNGIDDDNDGSADEGCGFSNSVMGVCPSPLSCRETGDIDAVTGAIVYSLPPDINPRVPYGIPLEFKRTYLSKYAPPTTKYRTAMGNRWLHNWQSWLDKSGSTVIVHLPTGQDVKFTYSGSIGGDDYYNTFQPGAHFKHLRHVITSPSRWELRTLTGETYVYDWNSPVGKLIEVRDTVQNKTVIAYVTTGSNTGQIDTVTDGSGKKRLKFSYNQGRVSSVEYQTVSGGIGTTRVTVSFSYTSANPTTVVIGSNTIQMMSYASGHLTNITDGDSKDIIDITYSNATTGKVMSVRTAEGAIGYDYASSNPQCTGGTVLFFNTTGTVCGSDSQCGGYRCGGKTGAGGNDGRCYRAARCLQTTSPSENLVTTIVPLSPCTGSCAPTAEYSWNLSTLHLKGIKLADSNWTSFQRDSNGMITLMAEGDSDDNPTNTGGAKTWYFYGASNFPGLVTEVRRGSDLGMWEHSCNDSDTDGCKRSQYAWNNTTGLLDSRTDAGWTGTANGSWSMFSYTTAFTHDSKGRLTQVDGPLSGTDDVTVYTYWASTDVLKDGYPASIQRKKNTSEYVTTVYDDYDYFGNAKSTTDPDGTLTCRTWDPERNALTQLRLTMNAQTSCATSHASDLVTNYVRDTRRRITKTSLPLGDCTLRAYDAFGRPSAVMLRDDCVSASIGSTRTETYDANGLNTKTEILDSSGTVRNRIERSYLDSMQIDAIGNPVAPSYARSFAYLSDAMPQSLTFENGLGKNESLWDPQNRRTTERRYTDATNYQAWGFSYAFGGQTSTRVPLVATDPASKSTYTDYDDLGRKIMHHSPDSGTTLYVYNPASQLVTMVEGYGALDQVIHTFTYDYLGRKLTDDYDDSIEDCTDGTGNITEVTYAYDESPVTCPIGALCTRQTGRLAHVKTKLLCDSTYTDMTLDQETFFAYDDAGRLVQEYIRDDSGRTADQRYSWDKNGNLTTVQAPSGAAMTYTFGGSGNSDANLVTTLARSVGGTPTNLLTNITWAPFGSVTAYDQANTIGGNAIRATFSWNLAYRANQIKYVTTSVNVMTIDYTEDDKGRITSKVHTSDTSSFPSTYLKYDWLDRLTCDATASGPCPTSGSTLRTNISYNTSNDRSSFYHQHPDYGDYQYNVTYVTGADKIASITQSGTGGTTSFGWDGRGNRTYDDNNNSSLDRRDYTYEGRRRLRTVTGKNWLGNNYRVTYAYDHKDRMVFRSLRNLTDGIEEHDFFYYDSTDRLIEYKIVPDISNPSQYALVGLYWLNRRPVAMWFEMPAWGLTARTFLHGDETNRILKRYTWPNSGDAEPAVGSGNTDDAFGWEPGVAGLGINNAFVDGNTVASKTSSLHNRPALVIDRGTAYDPFTGTTLQRFGKYPDESYCLGSHNPAGGFGISLTPSANYFGPIGSMQTVGASSTGTLPCNAVKGAINYYAVGFFVPAGERCTSYTNPVSDFQLFSASNSRTDRSSSSTLANQSGSLQQSAINPAPLFSLDRTCRTIVVYRLLRVKCDEGCGSCAPDGGAFCRVVDKSAGPLLGYVFTDGEWMTWVDGVHSAETHLIGGCSFSCNDDTPCDYEPGGGTAEPPP